jgi:ribosomal protein S18 acetylase RimI-like enzyme
VLDDHIGALIEANVDELLLSMGDAGGGSRRVDDEIAWTVGGSPIGYHNAVVRCAASDARGGDLVEEFRSELLERSLPGSWHLTPAMRPGNLPDLLSRAGFVHAGEEPAMAAPLSELPAAPPNEDLDVTLVETASDLEAYRDVLAAGFGEGPKEADWVASVYARMGFGAGGPWRHLVGSVRGEPVATASLLLHGAAAGIYFVCTTPGFRRRGHGATITHRAMLEGAACGAVHAVLGSSPMGQRVYERLGFRTVFAYQLYELEP